MADSSIDRSVTLPEVPQLTPLIGDKAVYDYLKSLHVAIAAFYDNLAERINQFLVLQDWQYNTHEQITGNQNNYDLGDGVVHRLSSDTSHVITGFLAPQVARFVILLNGGTQDITLPHQDTGSAVENRLRNAAGGVFTLAAQQTTAFWYDLEIQRWRQLSL